MPASSLKAPVLHHVLLSFPSYFISDTVPVWDESTRGVWQLEIGGMVERPVKLTLADLASLPRVGYRLDLP